MCELGIAQHALGDVPASNDTLHEALVGADAAGHRRIVLRARMEAAYGRLLAEPEGAADELLEVAEKAVPTFEVLEDDRSLARAWLLIGYVHGGIHGNHATWEEAEEIALGYYHRSGFPAATCLQQIACAIYWGPTPVRRGIARCTTLNSDETSGHFGRVSVLPFLGGLYAQIGEFSRARRLIDEAEYELTELGARANVVVFCGTVRADVELLAGDLHAAEATLREQCAFLEQARNRSAFAVRAAKLAETLYRQGRLADAEHWTAISRANAASDDRSVHLVLVPVEARLLARRGALSEARDLAESVVRLADSTDGLNLIASTRLALAEVLRMAELSGEARRNVEEAVHAYERKGNSTSAALARDLLGAAVPA